MMRKQILFSVSLLVAFLAAWWWYSGGKISSSYSLQALTDNPHNSKLHLRIDLKADYKTICDRLADLDRSSIEKYLSKSDPELTEVSYGLHYLGNRCLEANQWSDAMLYLEASAQQYGNAFSYLKLAHIYAVTPAEIQEKMQGQATGFKQDFVKAAQYLQAANLIANATLQVQNDNYIFNFVGRFTDATAEYIQSQAKAQTFDWSAHTASIQDYALQQQLKFVEMYRPDQSQQ